MKVSEIRIGNYIQSGSKDTSFPGKVLSINQESVDFEQVYCECDESFEWFFKNSWTGIPLTVYWLEKLVFKRQTLSKQTKDDYWVHDKLPEDVSYYLPYFNMNIHIGDITINYVHQLQNFYHTFTGEELEIE